MTAAGTAGSEASGPAVAPGQAIEAVFFYHVPKTAGMTLLKHFHERFPGQVFSPEKDNSPLTDILRSKKYLATADRLERLAASRAIAGHQASLSMLEHAAAPFYKVCFWRDPADYHVSNFNWRNETKGHRRRRPIDFETHHRWLLRNPMTRYFLLYACDVRGLDFFLMSDWRKFRTALANIERFDLFADISKVDGFIAALGCKHSGNVNVVPAERKKKHAISPTDRERLRQRNIVDLYIHRIALGENRDAVAAEADAKLSRWMDPRDIADILLTPWYRWCVVVWPYLRMPWQPR